MVIIYDTVYHTDGPVGFTLQVFGSEFDSHLRKNIEKKTVESITSFFFEVGLRFSLKLLYLSNFSFFYFRQLKMPETNFKCYIVL